MRVAIYAGMYKENQDGATKTLYNLTSYLLTHGIKTGVWGFSMTPAEKPNLQLYTVPSIPFPFYKDYRLTIPTRSTLNQMKAFAPDIIHITVPDITGQILITWAAKKKIPVVTSYHTDFISYLPSYKLGVFSGVLKKYFKFFYNQSAAVYAPTSEAITQLCTYGIRNTKIWSRGINLKEFSPSNRSEYLRMIWGAENKKVILFAGRFVWYKGLATFIKVYKQLSYRTDIKFVLAGDGPVLEELKEQMPDAVFTGYIKGEELSKVYASSDLFLFPSTTETFGNVVQEALASGLPSIVSGTGGCKEIVKKSGGGLIAESENSLDFCEKCLRIIENPELSETFRTNGLEYVKSCSWEIINGNLVKDYLNYINSDSFSEDLNFTIPESHYT